MNDDQVKDTQTLGMSLLSEAPGALTSTAAGSPYVVMARKYRPKDFSTLIGQEALVKTLTNAFAQNRLAHAFLLTGVRGVGKTTSARILAKAFNCTGADGQSTQPTAEPCGQCANCQAIVEDRHVDVLEIDAASNNGVDYIRELQSELHYKPVQGRYRIYIVDEVHMLSTAAFNAFLKTLEEPPEHVKFIFATTEANKLPVTIRSRCQRFDLRRVSADQLKEYFAKLAQIEGVAIDDEALALVAHAADGSVRDGLSVLDQAIALAGTQDGGRVTSDGLRAMLGLNDGTRVLALFEQIHLGQTAQAIATFDQLYHDGADPNGLVTQLAQQTHQITKAKVVGRETLALLSPDQADRIMHFAQQLSLATLNRTWEMLIKGLDELRISSHPQIATEMLIVRLCHVASLPDPEALLASLGGAADQPATAGGQQNQSADQAVTPAAAPEQMPTQQPSATMAQQPKQDAPVAVSPAPTPALAQTQTPAPQQEPAQSPGQESAQEPAQKPAQASVQTHPVTPAAPSSDSIDMMPPAPPPSLYEEDDLDSNFVVQPKRRTPAYAGPVPAALQGLAPPESFEDILDLLEENRKGMLATYLAEDVRPVSINGTAIRIRLTEKAPRDFARQLGHALELLTGRPWDVGLSDEDGEAPIAAQRREARAEDFERAAAHPQVSAILERFPQAEIQDIRPKPTQPAAATDNTGADQNGAPANATVH